jgi:hypothetical protein
MKLHNSACDAAGQQQLTEALVAGGAANMHAMELQW